MTHFSEVPSMVKWHMNVYRKTHTHTNEHQLLTWKKCLSQKVSKYCHLPGHSTHAVPWDPALKKPTLGFNALQPPYWNSLILSWNLCLVSEVRWDSGTCSRAEVLAHTHFLCAPSPARFPEEDSQLCVCPYLQGIDCWDLSPLFYTLDILLIISKPQFPYL
jgi:hypothetical protein